VPNASEALASYQKKFAAEFLNRARLPNGKIMPAVLRILGSMLMLN